jgi:hypothetical protein
MAVVFGKSAAERIAAATRRVERTPFERGIIDDYPVPGDDSQSIKLCKTTAAWQHNTAADLDEYTGTPGSEKVATPPVKVKAWNRLTALPAGVWVLVGATTDGYYLLAFDYEGLPNYVASKTQLLGHASGGMSWIDTTPCP